MNMNVDGAIRLAAEALDGLDWEPEAKAEAIRRIQGLLPKRQPPESALARHVKSTAAGIVLERHGRLPGPASPDEVEEAGRWLIALWHAQNASEYTRKDLAYMFLDGVQPIVSIDDECQNICGDEDGGDELSDELRDFLDHGL